MTHEEALSAALEAARIKYMKSVKEPWVHELVEALVAERDEARQLVKSVIPAQEAKVNNLAKHLAALRGAAGQVIAANKYEAVGRDGRMRLTEQKLRAEHELIATLTDTAEAAAQWQRSLFTSFVDAILHGDAEHRGWLIECRDNALAGKPVPPPRGQGRTESAEKERDETRREADDYLHELVDERARADDAFKLQAALREALGMARLALGITDILPVPADLPILAKRINAALTDTAEAAAQWVRVPEGHRLVPQYITDVQREAALLTTGAAGEIDWLDDFYEAAVAAAPKAGEAEGE